MSVSRFQLVRTLAAIAMVAGSTLYAIAQQPPTPTRVRGTIEAVDGDVLAVKSRGGEDVKLHMTGDINIVGISKIALSDIKVGSFIGTTTVPGPDGNQNAVEVHVFPEAMRGTGEGSRPYDLRPNSTMTNATVADSVVGNDGHTRAVFALSWAPNTPREDTMLKSSSWPRMLAASLTFVILLGSAAWAQQPPTVRIRGTIEAVDGPMLSIKSREGTDMKVRVTDNVAVFGVAKTELSEIKEGSYIGVTAMPEPDGTQKAVAVHIFPENQRGAAEGFRPWDQRPNSTMTNATVAQTVKGTDGQNILVKYKDGEKKVVVPDGTPIVTFVAGDKSELKPGAKIIIFGAVKKDDGTLEAARVNVGRDGITPPM